MKYLLSQIAAVCGGKFSGCDSQVQSVVTDSRSLSCELGTGPLFVAMRGANHDSHEFIDQMIARGVRGFLVERELDTSRFVEGCGVVQVRSAIDALQALAAHHRAQFSGTVVGITGSNGKTVIKEWIVEELPEGLKSYRSPKSYNSQLGVPLSVLMLEGDEELAIFEAGISKVGEMERLERIIRPDVVIFTSIGDAHQENFVSLEQKCNEKMILARKAKKIIYHSFYEPLAKLVSTHFAGRKPVDAARCAQAPESVIGSEASRRNAQIVETFCALMGYPQPAFASAPAVAMRLEVKEGINDSILINDAYNLDLNSLALALDYLHTVALTRRRTLVLSDVSQSGLSDEDLYGRVAGMVDRAGIDKLIGIGSRMRRFAGLFNCEKEFYASTDECIARINHADIASRAILLKGARDYRFEKIAHALSRQSHTTILEVNLDAMINNLNYFRAKMSFGTRLVAMVKAGSYGTGDLEIAQMLQHQGIDALAVAFADEGVLLRERGITMPIVVLNADADSFDQMVASRLEPEIYSINSLESFAVAVGHAGGNRYPIHIKLDTGMHRLGFVEEQIEELAQRLKTLPGVQVASIFSHLSCADMPSEDQFTLSQIALFEAMSSRLMASIPYPVLRHLANSAAIDRFPQAQFDMCRLGLGLYGFGFEHNSSLQPVSSLSTRIVQIKNVAKGEAVSYARVQILERNSIIATLPIGYADGLDRHLGCGCWSVLIAGQRAPIVGRICMDSCMVDITDIKGVVAGDRAVIFSPELGNDLETMARVLDTIPYEIMTSISGRVKRIYIKE